ncbi:MAG: hypothetical protein IPJ09_14425 [Saprospiraceae bacterium]|nr:hypothetical protein [Saprospiraceae bacterium]
MSALTIYIKESSIKLVTLKNKTIEDCLFYFCGLEAANSSAAWDIGINAK